MSHKQAHLPQAQKEHLKQKADKELQEVVSGLEDRIELYKRRAQEQRDLVPQFADMDFDALDPDNERLATIIAKTQMFEQKQHEMATIKDSPYFVKLDITWQENQKQETIYISKYAFKDSNIYSWVSPIASLRYGEIGNVSEYTTPDNRKLEASLQNRENFIITNSEIVFMTHEDEEYERTVIHQKHIAERRQFLLPEIVAELDKLQDQIIRSNPAGHFLISGPAGSGKTTLALHRIAYLVLTPEFKGFFAPEKIVVFVADQGAVSYFSKLLPELGIKGVRITTFMEWATMIANSRFRAKVKHRFRPLEQERATEFIATNNPLPKLNPRLVLDEYRKLKQEMIQSIQAKEGTQRDIYPQLRELYTTGLTDSPFSRQFQKYLQWQQDNKYLDEVDLTIILQSLDKPIEPFAHMVIDEVQNWLPEQLDVVSQLVSRNYNSITFVGDIRQKTKAFTVNDWQEINSEFTDKSPHKVELLKVYRNTKQILEHLQEQGYQLGIDLDDPNLRDGVPVKEVTTTEFGYEHKLHLIKQELAELEKQAPGAQAGILAKYEDQLAGYEHLAHDVANIHVLTIEEAQGLEFHTVILLDAEVFETSTTSYLEAVGYKSAQEYSAQDWHLYYVAVTRAQEQLIILKN